MLKQELFEDTYRDKFESLSEGDILFITILAGESEGQVLKEIIIRKEEGEGEKGSIIFTLNLEKSECEYEYDVDSLGSFFIHQSAVHLVSSGHSL